MTTNSSSRAARLCTFFLAFLFIASSGLPLFDHRPATSSVSALSRADEDTTFTDVAEDVGLGGVSMTTVAWGDYNDDGYEDLLVQGKRLFRNNGPPDWDFTEIPSSETGITAPTYSGVWADYDNDGDLDLFTVSSRGDRADCLWQNNGDGSFTNATTEAGIVDIYETVAAAWGDFDGDGYVDLYLGNYEDRDNMGEPRPDYLWQNNRDGTFTDVSNDAGIRAEEDQCTRGINCGDFDNDGDLDIYVANYRLDRNYLWENDGEGHFTEVAQEKGVEGEEDDEGQNCYGHSIGASWADMDSDGDLDMFVANLAHNNDPYRGPLCDNSKLYRNDGPGSDYSFTNIIDDAGIENKDFPHDEDQLYSGPAWGDYDNDGDLDLYITQVYADISYAYSYLYRNNGDNTFTDVAVDSGVRVWDGWAVAWCDYDQDGNPDLLVGGRDGSDSGENPRRIHLFRNNGEANNNWLTLELRVGEGYENDINREAIGTRVKVTTDGGLTQLREVEGGTGTCATQNSMELELGFDDYQGMVDVEVTWYGQETVTLEDIELNQRLKLAYGGAIASIEGIHPNPATTEDDVLFKGGGYAKRGIKSYLWRSSVDGVLYQGSEVEFYLSDTGLNLSLGFHDIYLQIEDNDGDWSNAARTTLQVKRPGNTPPEIRVLSPSAGGVVNSDEAYFYWEASDGNGDELGYDVYLDQDEELSTPKVQGLKSTSYRATGLVNEAVYHWKVVARDDSGDSDESEIRNFEVNTSVTNTAPELALSSPPNRRTMETAIVLLEWEAEDSNGDRLGYDVYVDESEEPTTRVSEGQEERSFGFEVEDRTSYYWKVVAWDGEDETASAVRSFDVELVKNEAPEIELLFPDDGDTIYDTSVVLEWEGSDADGNNLSYDVYFGTEEDPVELLLENTTDEEATAGGLGYGERYYWKVVVFDGSEERGSDTWSFDVEFPSQENERPTVHIDSPYEGNQVGGIVKVEGVAFDEDGYIVSVEIRIDDGDWLAVSGTTSWSYLWDTTLVEEKIGDHTITVRAFDGELHSEEQSVTVAVDNQQYTYGPDDDDDGDFEIAGMNGYLVAGGAGVAVVAVIGVAILVMRRRAEDYEDYYDEEEYEDYEDYEDVEML